MYRRTAEMMLPGALFLGVILLWVVRFPDTLFHYPNDDAFFYLKIAANISRGLGTTFDGLNPTNGYHPLYLAVLVLISRLDPIQGAAGLGSVFILDACLYAIGMAAVFHFLGRCGMNFALRVILLASLHLINIPATFGTEAGLLFALAWIYLYLAAWKEEARGLRGLLAALVVLARLDALLLVVLVAVAGLWPHLFSRARNFARALGTLAVDLAPAAFLLLLFALYNVFNYGHPATISSWLKFYWPGSLDTGWFQTAGYSIWGRYALITALSCLNLFLLLRGQRTREHPVLRRVLLAANLFNLFYLAFFVLFVSSGVFGWHLGLPLSIGLAGSAVLLHPYLPGHWSSGTAGRRLSAAGLVLLAGLSALMLLRWKQPSPAIGDRIAISNWMRRNLPVEARIFQVDGSGLTGYLSERSVVNGDGLVNSWTYQDFIRREELPAYLQSRRIGYLLWDEFDGQIPEAILIPLWDGRFQVYTFASPPQLLAHFGSHILLDLQPGQLAPHDCRIRVRPDDLFSVRLEAEC